MHAEQFDGVRQLEHPVGQAEHVLVVESAKVPVGQLEAGTQEEFSKKLVEQLRQLVNEVQLPHGVLQAVQTLELLK